jgi:hypothetical protein
MQYLLRLNELVDAARMRHHFRTRRFEPIRISDNAASSNSFDSRGISGFADNVNVERGRFWQ